MDQSHSVFKMVSVRAPSAAPPGDGNPRGFHRIARQSPTALTSAVIAQAGAPDAARRARALAAEFMASARYVPTAKTGQAFLAATARLAAASSRLPSTVETPVLIGVFEDALGAQIPQLAGSDYFKDLAEGTWDSLYANVMVPTARPQDRDLLFDAVRIVWLIGYLADRAGVVEMVPIHRLLAAAPLVPPTLFPSDSTAVAAGVVSSSPSANDRLVARRDRLLAARSELDRLYRHNRSLILTDEPQSAVTELPLRLRDRREAEPSAGGRRVLSTRPRNLQPPIVVWRVQPGDLTHESQQALSELDLSPGVDDIPRMVDLLTREVGRITADLSRLAGSRTVRTIGSTRIYHDEQHHELIGVLTPLTPGDLVPVGPTQPSGNQQAAQPFRVLGIGDLLIIRETLLRYQSGELAHIENVLGGELKDRSHRLKRQTEEVDILDTEHSQLVERELQTTDRFELQRESQRVQQTDVAASAGVSVSANYGYVSVTATGNFAYNSSQTQSQAAASSYARTVTDRALTRIEEQVREHRLRRSLEEYEETNTHTLDATGRDAIRGAYQWVDKLYAMQIVNYGERLMIEFLVPEPAAFYIFAQRAAHLPGVAADEPIPPEDLGLTSHRQLTADNFAVFVAAYRIEDVEPPPAARTVIAKAFAQEQVDPPKVFGKSDLELMVPSGYRAGVAVVSYTAFVYDGIVTDGVITIGNNLLDAGTVLNQSVHCALNYEDAAVPFAVLTSDPAYSIGVEIECEITDDRWESWQLRTYTAVVAAYRARKAEYTEQLARSQVREGIEISGRNPELNRQVERQELQRSCITLLTGDRYEDAGLIQGNARPEFSGFPEIDASATGPRGERIAFLEQAFEWDQMTYQFHPYFWGRKAQWLETFPLDDVDPKFADFLRAGIARVVVPVPLTHAPAVMHFLATSEIWNGGPAPVIDDPLFTSIADDLRRQQADGFVGREGVVNVRNGSRVVDGVGSSFVDDDQDRQMMINGEVYRIAAVRSLLSVELTTEYTGADQDGVAYSIGGRLVGEPWTVRVPTSLVYLSGDSQLPDFTDAGPARP